MEIIRILVGVALLALGRKLFWLFVGAVGFVTGFYFSASLFSGEDTWVILALALLAGLLGAGLAIFFQRLAVGLAGFLAGGYLLTLLLGRFNWPGSELSWLPFVIGGVIGAIMLAVTFDWALIVLSSMLGAVAVVQTLQWAPFLEIILAVTLFALGIGLQSSLLRREDR